MAKAQSRLTLRSHSLELQVVAEVGGSIARFDFMRDDGARIELFRGCSAPYNDALEAGCFPLVPFANRIRGGSFTYAGRTIRLTPNMAGDRNPLHGQGWRGSWQPAVSPNGIELVFDHQAGEWPWDYQARQCIELTDNTLTIVLSCRNLSAEPMPCGLGLHPYFPCSESTVLNTQVTHAWTVDKDVLPVKRMAAIGRYDLRQRRICSQGLDNGFDGWGRQAQLSWHDRGLAVKMVAENADRFQVYSPARGGIVVIEPVQNANASLNRPQEEWEGLGLRLLSSNQLVTLRVDFTVEIMA